MNRFTINAALLCEPDLTRSSSDLDTDSDDDLFLKPSR